MATLGNILYRLSLVIAGLWLVVTIAVGFKGHWTEIPIGWTVYCLGSALLSAGAGRMIRWVVAG